MGEVRCRHCSSDRCLAVVTTTAFAPAGANDKTNSHNIAPEKRFARRRGFIVQSTTSRHYSSTPVYLKRREVNGEFVSWVEDFLPACGRPGRVESRPRQWPGQGSATPAPTMTISLEYPEIDLSPFWCKQRADREQATG